MKQEYEVYLRESSITVNNHLKPIEIVECDYILYDTDKIRFGSNEGYIKAIYNWQDVIKLVRLS